MTILSIDCGGVRDIVPTEVPSVLESKLSTGGLMTSMLTAPNDENRPLFASKDIAKFYKDHSLGTKLRQQIKRMSYDQSLKKTRLRHCGSYRCKQRILLCLEFDPFDFSTFLTEAHWHKLKDIR
ncbi:hypothetical protein SADUNF_Sadunf18G0118800 [Salix dunnii]|uniref:Uncharacterized protein n=1 Tax=Salix dunnii TaxID=1413687 RepID=A0A835J795_9ROSI|nr:hypothetical protein SADUNF_Sadunf18G0118800 [Salix dunnii]